VCCVCRVDTHPPLRRVNTYNCPVEDETRAPLQKAIDGADYEHGYRKNELDFLRLAVSVLYLASVWDARASAGALVVNRVNDRCSQQLRLH
jgi:hypothetical protein